MMANGIHRISGFNIVAPYTLTIRFDDETVRTIKFRPVLEGEIFGPLRRLDVFNAVTHDREAHTLVWPNGADFDPETLHDWARYEADLATMPKRWAENADRVGHAG
jgi:hypothetical protein